MIILRFDWRFYKDSFEGIFFIWNWKILLLLFILFLSFLFTWGGYRDSFNSLSEIYEISDDWSFKDSLVKLFTRQ